MKFLLALVAFCYVSLALSDKSVEITPAQLAALAKLDKLQLPAWFQSKAGDNSHWCCTSEQPINTVQRTKIVKEIHNVATKVKTGYTTCGFAGLSHCSVYTTKYKQVAVYHIGTYEVPDEQACPDHQVKCCLGYINVAGNCFLLSGLGEHMDLIAQLVQLGLIPPVGK